MPSFKFSLLTPVGRQSEWLAAAAGSVGELADILDPDGIRLRWVLSSDGPSVNWINDTVFEQVKRSAPVELVILEPVDVPTETHGRAALARNRGLHALDGRFVGFLDDDDLLDPDGYASMVRTAYAGDHMWVAGRHSLLTESGVAHLDFPEGLAPGVMSKGWLRTWMVERRVQPFVGPAGIVNREYLIAQGGFPVIPYHQDTQLWLDVTDAGEGLLLDESVYVWRRHDDQMTPKELGKRAPMWR